MHFVEKVVDEVEVVGEVEAVGTVVLEFALSLFASTMDSECATNTPSAMTRILSHNLLCILFPERMSACKFACKFVLY